MSAYRCVRVYPDGEARETTRGAKGLSSWLAHNRTFRPGNALFVDGVCAPGDTGYLDATQVECVTSTLLREVASPKPVVPVRLREGRYPDDVSRRRFRFAP